MEEHPLETYTLAIDSTRMILDYGSRHKVKSIVYISSIECYGQIFTTNLLSESDQGYIDLSSPRSSYPMGKRSAEYLCVAYAIQKKIPVRIARLTQTFGAGISKNDNRVFAQFARSIVEGRDIVLHTLGESAKPYLYTTDCVEGLLYILLKGVDGEVYNVANDDSFVSIRSLAEYLCAEFNPEVKVRVELHPEMGYAPITILNLSSAKLKSLGWSPHYDLHTMFERLIKSLRE